MTQAMLRFPERVSALFVTVPAGTKFHTEREVALMVLRVARQALQGGNA